MGSSDRRGETSLGSALGAMLRRLDTRGRLAEARVIDAWAVVAGAEIERHTEATGLRSGVFLVSVDTPAWATELSAMAEHLRTRMNAEIGQERVEAIRFTVSKQVVDEASRKRSEEQAQRRYGGIRVEPASLSAEERAAVERSVASIADAQVRDAVLRATVRDLEWKKGAERDAANTSEETSQRRPEQSL